MANEDNTGGVSFALPADVDDWVAETADQRGDSRDDICRRMVLAAHAVAADDRDVADRDVADLEDIDELAGQLEAQREEFVELLEDVRARVVQVKRETDAKAPADHDHPDYEADLSTLRNDLDELEGSVNDGFENFEDVLEYLLEESDDLEERATVLATAVVDLRDRWDEFAARERRRAEAERLQLAANRLGVRTASCEECGSSVDVALLTAPECPHCASPFADVVERDSLFGFGAGSHTLETGDLPALEGRAERATRSAAATVFDEVEAEVETEAEATADDGTDRERNPPTTDD